LQGVLRQFALRDDDGPQAPRVPELPGSPFAVCDPARSMTLRRLWLDTFDWRLYRSGLTLEQVTSRGSTEIVLTGRDGAVVASHEARRQRQAATQTAADNGRPAWPGRLEVLPPGPLRDHLSPVVGVRALLPVARAVSAVRENRVLNSDDKTVARIAVDRMSVTYPAAGTAQPRLRVTPLRGYQAQALKLADLLAAVPGVTDGGPSGLEAALAVAGRSPGGYTGKIDVKLSPRMPAPAALAAMLTALLDTLEANVNGTVRDLDTEFLHDLRVAVRRSRSVLKLAGDVLPEGLAARFGRELKWLGDVTTPTRDLDVYLLGYSGMAAGLIAATPEELEPFHEHLRRSREAAHGDLRRGLRSARFSRFQREWREALAAVTAAAGSRPSVARLAADRIARAHRRVIRRGSAINSSSPPESLHELRKRCKELRYLLEIFASLYDPGDYWRAVRDLKVLQDCLGRFQDTHVQHQEIRAFAAQMSAKNAPPTALLAMGEIAAELVTRQRQARGEFAARFRDFASPASQARIRALTGAV
jgi:CHAD domain-containing protein